MFYCSGISPGQFSCPEFVGQNIQDFCHVNDVQQLSKHLQEGMSLLLYSLQIFDRFVYLSTALDYKSYLFIIRDTLLIMPLIQIGLHHLVGQGHKL